MSAESIAAVGRPPVTRIPTSTYRLQLDRSFPFRAAAAVVPYLAALGIEDCYLSPFLEPCSDRSHGYDVADHSRISAVLGGETEYRAFSSRLVEHGMGQLIDVVPNHMGIAGGRNAWWQDVLENGAASAHAAFFDIDWEPVKPELRNRVLLPILGDQYGRVLENQELVLEFLDGALFIRYYDTLLPVSPRTYAQVLRLRLDELEEGLGKSDPHFLELQSIITATSHIPGRTTTDPAHREERSREKEIVKRRLDTLTRESPAVKAFIVENARLFNGTRGNPESFDRLDQFLSEQVYRLAFWQTAGDEINYRRFFDINELAAIRVEDPVVFGETHRLILGLVQEGIVTGLRIDHPDGLYAPARYLRDLQRAGAEASGRPLYVVVEKILIGDEPLPADWPVHGTTGYDFLNAVNGLFIDPAGERSLDQCYRRVTGKGVDFGDVVYETKKLVMDTAMASEVGVLGHRLARLSERHRVSRDFTDRSLTNALREVIACFPVYRTYIGDGGDGRHGGDGRDGADAGVGPPAPVRVSDRDRRYVEQAVRMAKRRNPTTSAAIFDFIRDVLCRRFSEGRPEADQAEELTFVMKLQQLTGPITAKGLEDTAFYRYKRLVSLNEVGGAPDRFGTSLEEFHRRNAKRLARWPGSLSATATHDTKRGEDVRARIDVLSELPREWGAHVRVWRRLNKRHRAVIDGRPTPDPAEEYLLYQTLVGAWPTEPLTDPQYAELVGRLQRYMFKALREAKVHVSWMNPHPDYDDAVQRFVAAILDRSRPNPFLDDFLPWQRRIADFGIYNSLSQTLLKVASPGVPDFYQGAELWDLSLVDPDNRRPVDYATRRQTLEALGQAVTRAGSDLAPLARELTSTREDGRIKLYLVHRTLTFRCAHVGLFRDGAYLPLEATGFRRLHVCAFARQAGTEAVLAVVPRLCAGLRVEGPPLGPAVWGDTWLLLPAALGGGRYRNVLTGEALEVAEREGRPALPLASLLESFPVALVEREG